MQHRAKLLSGFVVGLLGLAAVPQGHAQATWNWTGYDIFRDFSGCGGDNASSGYSTCAAVGIGTVAGSNSLVVRIANQSGLNGTGTSTIFTQLGFDNLDISAAGAADAITVSNMTGAKIGTPASWYIQNTEKLSGGTGSGVQLDFVGASGVNKTGDVKGSPKNGIASNCVQSGELGSNPVWVTMNAGCSSPYAITAGPNSWVQFSFNFTGLLTNASLDDGRVWVKGQNMEKCVNGACSGTAGSTTLELTQVPPQVVPEPISMALLGTGLAGVAAARRRRRKQEDE